MENTEGNGGPQADFVGERELSEIIRKLKKIILVWIHGQLTAIHVHIKSVRAGDGAADGTGDRYLNHLYTNKKWHVKQERIQIAEPLAQKEEEGLLDIEEAPVKTY